MATSSLDPVVVGALISLRGCNVVPPMHPSDRKQVGLTFRCLVKSGIDYHPDLIKEWLLNDGWTEKLAIKVSDISNYEKTTANQRDYPQSEIDRWREIGLTAVND